MDPDGCHEYTSTVVRRSVPIRDCCVEFVGSFLEPGVVAFEAKTTIERGRSLREETNAGVVA